MLHKAFCSLLHWGGQARQKDLMTCAELVKNKVSYSGFKVEALNSVPKPSILLSCCLSSPIFIQRNKIAFKNLLQIMTHHQFSVLKLWVYQESLQLLSWAVKPRCISMDSALDTTVLLSRPNCSSKIGPQQKGLVYTFLETQDFFVWFFLNFLIPFLLYFSW